MADKDHAGLPLKKSDIYPYWYLDYDLNLENLLLTVFSPKKVVGKGRPYEEGLFVANKDGIFASHREARKAVMGKQIKSTTTNLGSRAGDKTRATTASV